MLMATQHGDNAAAPMANAVKDFCSRIRENSVVRATPPKSHDFGYASFTVFFGIQNP